MDDNRFRASSRSETMRLFEAQTGLDKEREKWEKEEQAEARERKRETIERERDIREQRNYRRSFILSLIGIGIAIAALIVAILK